MVFVTGQPYPAKVVARAREHIDAGWSITKTIGHLEREFGVRPGHQTIRDWCADPKVLKSRRAVQSQGRYWGRTKLAARFSEPWKVRTMLELHAAGLTFEAVGIVAGVWWGEPLAEYQVRYRLRSAA